MDFETSEINSDDSSPIVIKFVSSESDVENKSPSSIVIKFVSSESDENESSSPVKIEFESSESDIEIEFVDSVDIDRLKRVHQRKRKRKPKNESAKLKDKEYQKKRRKELKALKERDMKANLKVKRSQQSQNRYNKNRRNKRILAKLEQQKSIAIKECTKVTDILKSSAVVHVGTKEEQLNFLKETLGYDGHHLHDEDLRLKCAMVQVIYSQADNKQKKLCNFKRFYDKTVIRYVCWLMIFCKQFFAYTANHFLLHSNIKSHEKDIAARLCEDFEADLRDKAFSPLRVIKIADSSQTSCLNWQATELLRKLIKTKKYERCFVASRSTYQLAQCAIEEVVSKKVPVKILGMSAYGCGCVCVSVLL